MSAMTLSNYLTVFGLCVLVLIGSALRSPHGPTQGASLASIVLMSVYVIAGPAAAVVVAGVGSLVQARRVPIIKRVFNSGQRILSAAGGAVAYVAVDGPIGDSALHDVPRAIVAVTLTGIVHQCVNALLMSGVLWLERGRTVVRAFFREVVVPTALPMLGYGYLGLVMALMWLSGLGVIAGLLTLVPLVVARWALSQDAVERAAQAATMRAFIQVIETKDLYTRGHSERVSEGVGMLGRHLRLPGDRQQALEHAGLLHDVGKVGVPTNIIRKPGRLDDSEMDAIRLHPARGVELIGNIPFLEEVKSAVLHHHEKYDGTGYPAGLSKEKIPYFARIIGIVDAFDCLTSTRSYRPARSVEETLEILLKDRHTHFDPQLVDAFVEVIKQQGWAPAAAERPAPNAEVEGAIDHDDLSLGSAGGASGSAAGPE
ncbi:HD-GYP domain-containing protein [Kribbella sp. NPDC049174]|uniref:HD-GYP domain-containing protein n=1 Tax=Kribbella sp. NPDC049174 TaxID=3364112 RepID=UPI003721C229